MKRGGPGKGGGQDPLTPLWTRLCIVLSVSALLSVMEQRNILSGHHLILKVLSRPTQVFTTIVLTIY